MIQTSTSFTKRKKGLSVSLDKKNRLTDDNDSTTSAFKTTSIRQSLDSANSSAKKNRIKFAQSYQKHETGSKFKRQSYLKITDQDIKLGGSKRADRCERKILPFSVTAPLSQYNSRIQFNARPQGNVTFGGERKVLRQSKVVNLTSNINYFQGMNLQKQNPFHVPNFIRSNPHPLSTLRQQVSLPLRKLQTLVQTKLQQSSLSNQSPKQLSPSPFKKLATEIQKKQQVVKQSMDRATLQKLKKVQIDIDQLLAKASQTRAMLLR